MSSEEDRADIPRKEEEQSSTSDEFANGSSQESEDGFLACSTDAGHPRTSPAYRLQALQDLYYCKDCDVHFRILKDHFIKHRTAEYCQYCNHGVFSYIEIKTKLEKPYHACPRDTEPSSFATPDETLDVNMNV